MAHSAWPLVFRTARPKIEEKNKRVPVDVPLGSLWSFADTLPLGMHFRRKNLQPREAGTSSRPPGDHQGDCTFQHAARWEGQTEANTAQQCKRVGGVGGLWRAQLFITLYIHIKKNYVLLHALPVISSCSSNCSTQFCPVKADVCKTASRPRSDIAADCLHLALLSHWAAGNVQAVRFSCLTGSLQWATAAGGNSNVKPLHSFSLREFWGYN